VDKVRLGWTKSAIKRKDKLNINMEKGDFEKRKLTRIDKVNLSLALLLKISLLIASIVAIWFRDWLDVFLSLLALFLTFLPNIVEKKLSIVVPTKFEFLVVAFIYASLYLGEARLFWNLIWWWDLAMHFLSGIIMGIIGFSLVRILNEYKAININPFFVAMFSFCFSLSMGAVWEVFEFFMDYFLHTNLQTGSLVDTMTDIMLDITGALFISILGYMHFKNPKFLKIVFK